MTQLTAVNAADLFRAEPHDYIPVSTGEVAYRRVGSGPDVLFVHGWPVSGATYRTLLPYLAEHVTCHLIDLPGTGSSRFTTDEQISLSTHIEAVRAVVDYLELDDVAVVGHDSGGLIARHAMAGDSRLRALGLIDTEQPQGLSWRFKSFLYGSKLPGFGAIFGWLSGSPKIRRNGLAFGKVFHDKDLLDGEFDEFFLQTLANDAPRLTAATTTIRSFEVDYVTRLEALHGQIDVPTVLVWGERDAFFPRRWAEEMAGQFPNAHLEVIDGAGLFSHEERPKAVAEALLPVLR